MQLSHYPAKKKIYIYINLYIFIYIYIYIYIQRSTHLRQKLKGRKFENKCCIIAIITENQAFLFNFFNAIITPE